MTVILMKHTAIGKRAYAVSREDADAMVVEGRAMQDSLHTSIYEEITPEEAEQGYMTRNLAAIPPIMAKKKPVKAPKSRVEESTTHPAPEVPGDET